jgi:hypothetical protein
MFLSMNDLAQADTQTQASTPPPPPPPPPGLLRRLIDSKTARYGAAAVGIGAAITLVASATGMLKGSRSNRGRRRN